MAARSEEEESSGMRKLERLFGAATLASILSLLATLTAYAGTGPGPWPVAK
jgi:hypothetical protein